ncbi:MAG: hypothetical protein AB1540_04560 [Bdellovibrionota bacterium]
MFRNALAVLILVGAIGCSTKSQMKDSPQKTLSDYVSRSFAIKNPEEKRTLLEFTTGKVKSTLEKLDDGSFKAHFIDKKREFISLKVKDERALGEGKFSVTYELTYLTKSSESENKITNKKHAVFVKEDGKWLISEVQNLKTFIEHENEMSL